jgi:hypothetical protein
MLVVRGRLERRQAIVEIGIQPFIPSPEQVNGYNNEPVKILINPYKALLDTGAQRTCLTQRTIKAEGLTDHGKRLLRNVHSEALHRLYYANIGFWANGILGNLNGNDKSYFAWDRPIEVMNIADNENFDAIIGMDVLEHFSLKFEKGGQFEMVLG